MSNYEAWLEELSKELKLYGKVKFDLETEEANGYRRVRVFEYKHKKYIHHMFNGENIELIEI